MIEWFRFEVDQKQKGKNPLHYLRLKNYLRKIPNTMKLLQL